MKKIYLCLLAIVLFTGQGQVSAQTYKTEVIGGRTVHFIPAGSDTHFFDRNRQAIPMSSSGNNYGYMKFVVENGEAWVFSTKGHTGNTTDVKESDPLYNNGVPKHWAIENGTLTATYTGNIYIPAYISINGTLVPVVGIEDHAFVQLPLKGTIDIQSPHLRYIGCDAFDVLAKDNSYTKVTIRTEADLWIKQRAFKNSIFTIEDFKKNGNQMDRQTCLTKGLLKYNRTCLREVDIQSLGKKITILPEAFVYCEGLENVNIVSKNGNTFGEIEIGYCSFSCRNIVESIYDNKTLLGTANVTQPLDRMWTDRTNYLDSIYIQGKVTNIGNIAFSGHVNIKRVVIKSPTDYYFDIGQEAFLGLFHGYCDESNLSDTDKEKMGVFITGPISSIGYDAFQHFYYANPAGTGPSTEPTPPNNISFTDCLNTVEINHTGANELEFPSLRIFGDRFVQTTHNSYPGSLKLTGNIINIDDQAFCFNDYIYNNIGKSRLRDIEINSTIPMRIGKQAFKNQMTSASPNQEGSIILNNAIFIDEEAFYNNNKAMTVTINNDEATPDLRVSDWAFEHNFKHSSNDGTLTINGKLNSIGKYAFANGPGLQTFNLTSDSRFSIGVEAFANDITLSKMKYTAGGVVTNETLPDRVTKVGNRAFANTGFIEMTIPQLTLTCKDGGISEANMVKVRVTDDSGAKDVPATISAPDVYNRNNLLGSEVFADCTKLDSVSIKNSATGQATFANCTQLSKVEFDTNVKYIESGVFANTPLLTWLDIPANVEVIGAAIKTGRKENNLTSYRIKFNAKQPPLAHYHAFATAGDKKSTFNNWTAYVVVPWGCVSSYLFCSTDRGFQNVTGDHIACEYKLNKTWGTLGMQAHTNIKEYTGNFEEETDYGYSSPKLTELNKTSENYSFTDVYDFRRVGTDNGGNDFRTTLKISDTGDYALRIEKIENIKDTISLLTDKMNGLTATVFGVNVDYNGGQGRHWYSLETGLARLGCIFQFYQERNSLENITLSKNVNAKSLIPNQDIQTFANMCETLWNDLKPILDPSIQSMTLQQFVTNFAFPKVGPDTYSSNYYVKGSSIENFINVFYGAPTLKLLELLQTNQYYDYFVLNFLNNIFQYVTDTQEYESIFGRMEKYYHYCVREMGYLNTYCDFTKCTANDKSPITNLYNKYNEYVGKVQDAIDDYNAAFPNHINWEIDKEFYESLNEPFYVYTADTYYKETGKVGIDLLTAGPIIPNSLNDQPWNNGYLVKGKPQTSYFLFHYVGEGLSFVRNDKLDDYSKNKYVELKNTTSVNRFKNGQTHCPTIWWANTKTNQSGGFYKYNVYPNLLVAACNASDITAGHYLYGISPETDVINFVLNYGVYQKDATDGVSTKCRFFLLSNGQFMRFRQWTQLSEGKSFLALPTQTMAGYPDDPHVGATGTSGSNAKAEFFLFNNDFRFSGDFNPIVTDIETIGYENEEDGEDGEDIRVVSGYWYTLDGTRLATPPTKKGIYIHNGKKIVIK